MAYSAADYLPPGLGALGSLLPLILDLIQRRLPGWAKTLTCVIWACIIWLCFKAIMLYAHLWAYSEFVTIIFLFSAVLSGIAAFRCDRRRRGRASWTAKSLWLYLILLCSLIGAAANSTALQGDAFLLFPRDAKVEFSQDVESVQQQTWFGHGERLKSEDLKEHPNLQVTIYEDQQPKGPYNVWEYKQQYFGIGEMYKINDKN